MQFFGPETSYKLHFIINGYLLQNRNSCIYGPHIKCVTSKTGPHAFSHITLGCSKSIHIL